MCFIHRDDGYEKTKVNHVVGHAIPRGGDREKMGGALVHHEFLKISVVL